MLRPLAFWEKEVVIKERKGGKLFGSACIVRP